ncbi:MAG: uncharacterized protein PWP39_1232 [Pyrococcus sp.]|nr:uncharacterized protein [Pyrococcus sp.]
MNHFELFVDSSVLVGLNLGDEKAKALVKSLIERGLTLVQSFSLKRLIRLCLPGPSRWIEGCL